MALFSAVIAQHTDWMCGRGYIGATPQPVLLGHPTIPMPAPPPSTHAPTERPPPPPLR